MKIFDKEFAFSSLNANDIERLEQAKAKLEKAEEAERQRAQQTPNMSYAEGIRGQCRIVETFIDDVLAGQRVCGSSGAGRQRPGQGPDRDDRTDPGCQSGKAEVRPQPSGSSAEP